MAAYILLSTGLLLLYKPRNRKIDDTPGRRIIFSRSEISIYQGVFFFYYRSSRTRVSVYSGRQFILSRRRTYFSRLRRRRSIIVHRRNVFIVGRTIELRVNNRSKPNQRRCKNAAGRYLLFRNYVRVINET